MTAEERGVDLDPVLARVDRIGLAATDAGGAGLDAPAATVVVADHAAVGVGLRTAAAHGVEAVALLLLFAAELVDELAVLEVAAALAIVVNRLIEDQRRLAHAVELGDDAHEDDVDEHGDQPLGIGRAARHVDDRGADAGFREELLNAHGAHFRSHLRRGAHPSAVDRTAAESDDCVGVLGGGGKMLGAGSVRDAQRLAVPSLQHGTLVDEDVIARLDGLLLRFLHRISCRGGKGFAVVQRNHLQHDGRGIRLVYLSESLRATRARRALDPDDRIELALFGADHRLFKSLSDLRNGQLGCASGRHHCPAQLEEVATADAAGLHHGHKLGMGILHFHVHTSLVFSRLPCISASGFRLCLKRRPDYALAYPECPFYRAKGTKMLLGRFYVT